MSNKFLKAISDIKSSGLDWMFVRNWNSLRSHSELKKNHPWILCSSESCQRQLVKAFGASQLLTDNRECCEFSIDDLRVFIVPKGYGLFPERFETALLLSKTKRLEDEFFTPSFSHEAYIALYWSILYEEYMHEGYQTNSCTRARLFSVIDLVGARTSGFTFPRESASLPLSPSNVVLGRFK